MAAVSNINNEELNNNNNNKVNNGPKKPCMAAIRMTSANNM
jgi:hypothetical protein